MWGKVLGEGQSIAVLTLFYTHWNCARFHEPWEWAMTELGGGQCWLVGNQWKILSGEYGLEGWGSARQCFPWSELDAKPLKDFELKGNDLSWILKSFSAVKRITCSRAWGRDREASEQVRTIVRTMAASELSWGSSGGAEMRGQSR